MVYVEYEVSTKQVVEIHEQVPIIQSGYDYAQSNEFIVGDEFEQTIWINEVDNNRNIISYAAIRNNPNAQRLLRENIELKEKNSMLEIQQRQTNEDLSALMDFVTTGGM